MKRAFCVVMLLLLASGVLTSAFNIRLVKSEPEDRALDSNKQGSDQLSGCSVYGTDQKRNMSLDAEFHRDDLKPECVPGEVLVKFKTSIIPGKSGGLLATGIGSINELNKRFGVTEITKVSWNMYEFTFLENLDVVSVVKEYASDPNVEQAQPNYIYHASVVPNDANYTVQWAHKAIESERAWDIETGNPDVVIAVVDSGVDWHHPDLAANIWNNTREMVDGLDNDGNGCVDDVRGWDFVDHDNDPMDSDGHGTHCAGIAAAVTNNSIGIAGVSWKCKIMPLRGGLETSSLVPAIRYAADNGAKIISMSWGGYAYDAVLYEAIKYAYDKGLLLVAAAGNDLTSDKLYPAAFDEVVAVTATDRDDKPAWFTNFGEWVEIAAPGVDIYSTVPHTSYANKSGTSMATPHVAGLAALIWSRFPRMTSDAVRMRLKYTSDDLGDPGFDDYYGHGRINARRAVEQTPHDLIVTDWQRPLYVNPGTTALVNTTVFNLGASDENYVSVKLLANGSVVGSSSISFLASGGSATVTCQWRPTSGGAVNLTSYVVPVTGETVIQNNVVSAYVYVGFPVKAFVIHSAGTNETRSIETWRELNTKWYMFGDKMMFVDYSTLNKENIAYEDLSATGADVLIISCAWSRMYGWEFTDGEIEAIRRYVYEGHGLIATAGTFYEDVPNNNKLAPLFGLNESTHWQTTYTDLLHILNPALPIFAKIPDPYAFRQVLTVVPSDGRWDSNELFGGTYAALGHFKESAITVFRGLVYISPWLEIIPPYYHFHLQLLYNAMAWSRYQKPQHEITVFLDCPPRLEPNQTSLLNATVSNLGLNPEKEVGLQLMINGIIANSTIVPELLVGSSFQLSYSWKPTALGTYNVTAYAPPLPGEEFTANNLVTKMISVRIHPTVALISDDSQLENITPILDSMGIAYDTYDDNRRNFYTADTHLLSEYKTVIFNKRGRLIANGEYVALKSYISSGGNLVVTGMDSLGYPSDPLLADIVCSSTAGDDTGEPDLYVVDATHPIMNGPFGTFSAGYHISGLYEDCDRAEANTTRNTVTVAELADGYDKIIATEGMPGKIVYWNGRGDDDWSTNDDCRAMLKNMLFWFRAMGYEHDLAVSLQTPERASPDVSVLLKAAVINVGSTNETNVKLVLLVNDTAVNSTNLELATGSSYVIRYSWTPALEANYNVTAYAPPLPGEEFTANNLVTKMISVLRPPPVALISDDSQLGDITPILDSMGIAYDTYNDNRRNFYTADVGLLLVYKVVIFNKNGRMIKSSEHSALQSYLSSGGDLLVTGLDSLGFPSDPLLADIVCSSTTGDDTGKSDLYVVDATHPIMNGPFGSFPVGYHISGLYGDCDRAEANTTRNAVTVAELTDGNDKIIATEALPGKVVYWNGRGDDDWSTNDDCQAMFKNLIHWFVVRPEHELAVSLQAPVFLEPGDSTVLNATVHNAGLNDETDVNLQLLINDTVMESEILQVLMNGTSHTISRLWIPTITGTYNVTVYAPPVPGENITRDNVYSRMVPVQYAPRILAYVQYTDYDEEYANTLRGIELAFGPNYILTELQNYTQLSSMLAGNGALLIPEQENAELSVLERIGANWSATLFNFVNKGGVIILCDYNGGDGGTYGILRGAGLMSITDVHSITGSTVHLVNSTDPLARNVSSSFTAPNGALSFITNETGVVFNDGTYPVVLHKTVGEGNVILIGFDYFSSNTQADQILGNAIRMCTSQVPGELNHDGVVNILDLTIAALAWGSYPGHLRWNQAADLDGNGIINILDITQLAKNFGRTS